MREIDIMVTTSAIIMMMRKRMTGMCLSQRIEASPKRLSILTMTMSQEAMVLLHQEVAQEPEGAILEVALQEVALPSSATAHHLDT